MAKRPAPPHSEYARDALSLLGGSIRERRIALKMPAADLAERAGISRGLLQRIELGEPSCAIGSAFEVAALLGIPLFEQEPSRLALRVEHQREKLALLPKSARPRKTVPDNF